VEFVKTGGTVVHACAFSGFISPPSFKRYFKYGWGVPWEMGDYSREDFHQKEGGGHGINRKGMLASYSQKAVALNNVAAKDALYLLKKDLPGPSNGALCRSPVVFRKIESGFMGYVGDVNYEEGSNRVILAMFGMN
jgi:hypothetical protein